ncbi:hypothetical protein [Tenacibaculum sp. SG-28]|uniref:hypothetical protein n=1 Tax=Tenacibaculum sp. SG-28 TaxID=754426 RepID=UPI000CF397B2|nr:hypothetical protein [Tenacibaculum sp. SG-28]PQJ23004.1 hypothetical protein BSU00_01665 [Tenacibaculum sp. SG-28]
MNFLKKLFKSNNKSSKEEVNHQPVNLSLDDLFVHNFINKGGKFLYCTNINEVLFNLESIINENNWDRLICKDYNLLKICDQLKVSVQNDHAKDLPFFTSCEYLISDKGAILFTSNQLGSKKISEVTDNFIVYATMSQVVKNTNQGLTGIKTHFSGNIPNNISSVTKYTLQNNSDDFLNYGNSNSKNLYLLLFEDL